MENSPNSENGDLLSSFFSDFFSVPKLADGELYHVFISFSRADFTWVKRIVCKLEATFPDIKICSHYRDFTPGKTIIENMTECIQRSQKILLVLSPDFVHSRWCLYEANLSMFQDCTSHKAIVPVMLKPCPMPLYLSHLTYLEAEDEQFFEKLCNKLLKTNAKETEDVLVHFQSSILYGGKHLLSLSAVNENDAEIYKEAIRLIKKNPLWFDILGTKWTRAFIISFGCFLILFYFFVLIFAIPTFTWCLLYLPISILVLLCVVYYKVKYLTKHLEEKLVQDMSRRTGEANVLLAETSILAYRVSMSTLVFVLVSLNQCKDMFHMASGSDTELAKRMWKNAMIRYSSDYANCLAKKHFPCGDPRPPGHLADGFCQYVAIQIEQGHWP